MWSFSGMGLTLAPRPNCCVSMAKRTTDCATQACRSRSSGRIRFIKISSPPWALSGRRGVLFAPQERRAKHGGHPDISAVAAKVFTTSGHEGKTYVITGPEALTFHQVAEKLSSVLGRNIQYVDVPLSTAADGMRKSGMPEWDIRAVTELLGYFASGAAATVTDTIPRLLGRPAISLSSL